MKIWLNSIFQLLLKLTRISASVDMVIWGKELTVGDEQQFMLWNRGNQDAKGSCYYGCLRPQKGAEGTIDVSLPGNSHIIYTLWNKRTRQLTVSIFTSASNKLYRQKVYGFLWTSVKSITLCRFHSKVSLTMYFWTPGKGGPGMASTVGSGHFYCCVLSRIRLSACSMTTSSSFQMFLESMDD